MAEFGFNRFIACEKTMVWVDIEMEWYWSGCKTAAHFLSSLLFADGCGSNKFWWIR